MMISELDDTLKSLNGLHDDCSSWKRKKICNYIQEYGMIAVFAYASLLWNPIEYVDKMVCNCILNGYTKGFVCEDFVYRGTTDFIGLTMGLKEDTSHYTNGALLISHSARIIPFLKAFVRRETPTSISGTKMDIYQYDFVEIVMPDRLTVQYALTCLVNKNNSFYSSPQLTLEEQAQKMAIAYGKSGTNLQYLKRTIEAYRYYDLKDSCTAELEDLYNQIIACRQSLSINDQKWLEIYDELQTLEERQKALKFYSSVTF